MMTLPTATATSDPSALMIFSQARAALVAREFPPTIRYKVRVSGLQNGSWSGRTYQTFEEWPEQTIRAHSISEEEASNPVKPAQFSFFGLGPAKSEYEKPPLLGIPRLRVTYAFGLGRKTSVLDQQNPSSTSLKTIGTVLASAQTYVVSIVGEESIDDSKCWHLALSPIRDPQRYRIRDVWVDEQNYETRRLRTLGNFADRSTSGQSWLISFTEINGSWYIHDELSQSSVNAEIGRFDAVDVQFFDIADDSKSNLDFGISGDPGDLLVEEPNTF